MNIYECIDEHSLIIMAKNKPEARQLFRDEYPNEAKGKMYIEKVSYQFVLNTLCANKEAEENLPFNEVRKILDEGKSTILAEFEGD